MDITERVALEARAKKIGQLCRNVPVCKDCPLDSTSYCDTAIAKMTEEQLQDMIDRWNSRFPYNAV